MSSKPALPPRPPSSTSIHQAPSPSNASTTHPPSPSQSSLPSPTQAAQPAASNSLSASTALSSAPPPFPLPAGFTLPAYYHFPPFFTLQPNATTRAKQLKLWVDLLVAHTQASANTPTAQPLTAAAQPAPARPNPAARCAQLSTANPTHPLFAHPRLGRLLSTAAITAVLAAATAADYCVVNAAGTVAWLLGRPVGDWAEALYGWAGEAGAGGGAGGGGGVYTLYELQCGVAVSGAVFYGLPLDVLFAAVQRLAQQGRCVLIKGDVISETGIKFK